VNQPAAQAAPPSSAPLPPIDQASTAPRLLTQILFALGITGDAGPKSSNWQALRHPGFRWYFAGSVTSNFGTWLQNTAQVVLAYQLTHRVLAVGLVTCAQFTSPLLLGPWAAVLAHRMGNWRALMATQIGATGIAAFLTALEFSGSLTIHWLYGCALGIGLAFTFALPAMSVMVTGLFADEQDHQKRAQDIKRAMAMDSVSYNLGRALAPLISVLIFSTIGFGWAFLLNAVTYFLFIVILVRLRPRKAQQAPGRSRVMNGLSIALNEPRIMVLLLMVAAVTVAADPILVLGPAMAGRIFHSNADWSGVFIAALGAGNVVGSFRRPRRRSPSIRRAATVLAMLALTMMIFAAAPWLWLSVTAAFAVGMACLMAGALTRSLLIECAGTTEKRQAAVMAGWAVAWAGSKPIASLVDGSLAGWIGVRTTGVLLAVPALLPALVLVLLPVMERPWGPARFFTWLADAKGPAKA
jgi:MFS family permease